MRNLDIIIITVLYPLSDKLNIFAIVILAFSSKIFCPGVGYLMPTVLLKVTRVVYVRETGAYVSGTRAHFKMHKFCAVFKDF